MIYSHHFQPADDLIDHFDKVVKGVKDPALASQYVGFAAVAAVTVYELALKQIFFEFAEKKHKVLATFTYRYFDRINGRIKIRDLKTDYIPRFGEKYLIRFTARLQESETRLLRSDGLSISSSYGNIIAWRNQFAHEGTIPSTPTYEEVKNSYEAGKQVLHCLAQCMRR